MFSLYRFFLFVFFVLFSFCFFVFNFTLASVPVPNVSNFEAELIVDGSDQNDDSVFDAVRDFIFELLGSFFTVEDNYFTDKLEHYKDIILSKLPAGNTFNELMDIEENDILNVDGDYSVASVDFSDLTFVDFSYFNGNKELFRKLIDGFFSILFFLYNLNQFIFLLRGTYPFRIGRGEADAD